MATAEAIKLDDRRIARYRDDVVSMLEDICQITHPLTGELGRLQLYDHQRKWLTEADSRDSRGDLRYHDVIACWPKGDGKTLVVAGLLVHRLLFYPGSSHYILANSERQGAAVLYGEVRRLLESSPQIMRAWQPEIGISRIRIPQIGTQLDVLPCNRRTVQGYRPGPWGIFASDEVHAAQDTGAFDYLAAQCEARNALVAVSSQAGPPIQDNPVYGYYQLRDEPEVYWDYADEVRAEAPKRQAERDRKRLSPAQYGLFWRNAWGSKGIKLLEADDVDACVHNYELPTTPAEVHELLREQWDTRTDRIVGGLDRAMSYMTLTQGDRTVWATVARTIERPRRYIVLQVDILGEGITDDELQGMTEQERSELSKGEVIAAAGRAHRLGAREHVLEQYQAQDLVGQIPGSKLVHMTQPRKIGLYNMLGELVTSHRLIIPASPALLREELLSITVDTSTSSMPRFEGKPHDDTVDAVLNAIDGAKPLEGEHIIHQRCQRKPRGA